MSSSPGPAAPESHVIAAGGSTAQAQLFRAADPTAPCLVVFPALGTAARPYLRFAAALQARGVHVLVADWRGVASSSVRAARGVDWGYLDLVDGEAEAMLALVRDELPLATPHCFGHSLGGQVAMLHAARHPQRAAHSIILAASASPHYRAYPQPYRWLVFGFGWLAAASSLVLGVFRGDWFTFGGRQGARLMREWAQFVRHGRIPALGADRWDAEQALAAAQLPIFILSMRDDRFAPLSAARELAQKSTGMRRFERIESLPSGVAPGHFAWMREPDLVAERVVHWLQSGMNDAGAAG